MLGNQRQPRLPFSWFFAVGCALAIAVFFTLPILRGKFLFVNSEYYLYQSYIRWFIQTLKHGELPLWNPLVGNGHPAIYFGHYPIHQSLLIYFLFGYSDLTYSIVKLISVFLLFLGYIYMSRRWGTTLLQALLGALVYFGINFCVRKVIPDTTTNVPLFFPLVFWLLLENLRGQCRDRSTLLVYFLVFCLWITGGAITYLLMPQVILTMALTIYVVHYRASVSFAIRSFLILLVVPWITIAYQIHLVYDVIKTSGRLQPGLVVSPLQLEVYEQFFRSLASSSYFWVTLLITSILAIYNAYRKKKFTLLFGLLSLSVAVFSWGLATTAFCPFKDYVTALTSVPFIISMCAYLAYSFFFHREKSRPLEAWLGLLIIGSLLSYYFFLPDNIRGGATDGYDYQLFGELGHVAQVLLMTFIFLGWHAKRGFLIKVSLGLLIFQYLVRSHLSLFLLRFLGIVWYATRDGFIFSLFFSILFVGGLQVCKEDLSQHLTENARKTVSVPLKILGLCFLGWMLFVCFHKMYRGASHQYLSEIESTVTPEGEFKILSPEGFVQIQQMRYLFKDISAMEKTFFRIFSPENGAAFLAGAYQDLGIYEAAMYDSTISASLMSFYWDTVLGVRYADPTSLREAMPYGQFAKHFHAGIGLRCVEIPYRGFYLINPGEAIPHLTPKVDLWWKLSRIKYLVLGYPMLNKLQAMDNGNHYKVVAEFPSISLNVVRFDGERNLSPFAFLPFKEGETLASISEDLNAKSLATLRQFYDRLEIWDEKESDALLRNRRYWSEMEIPAHFSRPGLFIHFESWNKNWQVIKNGTTHKPEKAFQLFRAIEVGPDTHTLRFVYRVPGFYWILGISILALFLVPLGIWFCLGKNGTPRQHY